MNFNNKVTNALGVGIDQYRRIFKAHYAQKHNKVYIANVMRHKVTT